MANLNAFHTEHDSHDTSVDDLGGFDSLLDKISKNMEEAAQIPFCKRSVEYDKPSSVKRRNLMNFQGEDGNLEYSFVSNNRSFSREFEDQLPRLVSIRSPLEEEIGFLEALNNPEYLQAVKDLSEPLDLRNPFPRRQNNSESNVEADCLNLSYVIDEFTLAETNLTKYINKARKLLSIGVFHQENDELDVIDEKYSETLANMNKIFEQLDEINLSGANPSQTSQELAVILEKIREQETRVRQLEQTKDEKAQVLTDLKRSMDTFLRALDERIELLAKEKARAEELERDIARIKGDAVDLELKMASVTQEIADLKAQNGNYHPMFKPFQDSLGRLLGHTASAVPATSLPHIDNLAYKLLQRIDQVTSTCQEFLRPSIEKKMQRELEKAIVSRIADVPLDKIEDLGLPSAAVIGAFVLNRLLEESQPSWVDLNRLKGEAHQKLGVDTEQIEAVIFGLSARELIIINHSSQQVSVPSADIV